MHKHQDRDYIKKLLQKYKEGRSTPAEVRELMAMMQDEDVHAVIAEDMKKDFHTAFPEMHEGKVAESGIVRHMWRKIAVAASVLIFIAAGLVIYLQSDKNRLQSSTVSATEEIHPGGNRAMLIMDDGKKVFLDSAHAGTIAVVQGTVISINENGDLVYHAAEAEVQGIINNTVSTPAGGFFSISLPDGSRVWLNSESEISFPSRFPMDSRVVSLKGEGYFQVAHDPSRPFRVKLTDERTIEVLGTTFNVMSYANEPEQKVTLLEGKIRYAAASGNYIVHPGEQVVIADGKTYLKTGVSAEHETAWKNGLFDFQSDDLGYILRQIARWYNVEIVYSASDSHGHYTGAIRKSSDIAEVLKMLELAGDVHFTIVGKKIVVNEKDITR